MKMDIENMTEREKIHFSVGKQDLTKNPEFRNDSKRPGYWKPKFTSAEQLEKDCNAYFDKCDELGDPYLITGLALHLDTNRHTLLNYEYKEQENGGEYGSIEPTELDKISSVIKRAKARCEHYNEKGLIKGTINPTAAIFALKATHKWVDKNELDITSGNEKMQNIGNIQIIMPEVQDVIENQNIEQIDGSTT